MPDLAELGIDVDTVRQIFDEWRQGAKKSALERKYLDKPESHGKLFSSLVREHLGIETERRSTLTDRNVWLEGENERLRALLRLHGIDPNETPSGRF